MFPSRLPIAVLIVLAALFALLAGAPARAQDPGARVPLTLCVQPDRGEDVTALIRSPRGFDCHTPQHRFGAGDFWVTAALPAMPGRDPVVRSASVWQTGSILHILYADGAIRRIATGPRGVTPFLQLGAIVEQPLPVRAAAPVRLLWQVRGAANIRGIVAGASLADAADGQRANLAMGALYGAFAGLCLALILYNLALWAALRHRFQLYYCAMVACLLGYTFSTSGGLAWLVPAIANNDRLRLNYLLLATAAAAALVFARSFFEPRVFAGWLGRCSRALAVALVLGGLAFALFAPVAVVAMDRLCTALFCTLPLIVVPMLWRAWRLRSNYLWAFALGWGLPIFAALLRSLASLHLIRWSFWIDNSTILAMAAEAVLSAVAIAYRIKLLRDERDGAIAKAVMARRLADTDPLTGLLNRRAFLERAIGRPGDQVLLIADLDHFKHVNDTLGHDGGDEVLRLFARVLRASVPAEALVARLGGEEFAVLSPAAVPVEADHVLARLRATAMPFDLRVTASIGTCRGPLGGDSDWKALYRGADAALFQAKSAGRDRVRSAVRAAA
jgi:diguanylate cyclase (GGDEF)-like protein